jgi:hypothetical protein
MMGREFKASLEWGLSWGGFMVKFLNFGHIDYKRGHFPGNDMNKG